MRAESLRALRTAGAVSLLSIVPSLAPSEPPSVAAPPLPSEVPSSAEMRSVLMAGHLAGTEAVWRTDDGRVHVFFEFNDRGRGPKVWTEITPGRDGIPTALQNTGVDYLKAPVDERFSLVSGTASWHNRAEHGSKDVAEAFYVSMNGPTEEARCSCTCRAKIAIT